MIGKRAPSRLEKFSALSATDPLNRFIRETFRSVWSLELMLHLKRQPGCRLSSADLVRELRSSEHIVVTAGAQLVAAGLLTSTEDLAYGYTPASDDLARMADAVEAVYAKSPDAVRRIIVSPSAKSLTAFADAFRLRRE